MEQIYDKESNQLLKSIPVGSHFTRESAETHIDLEKRAGEHIYNIDNSLERLYWIQVSGLRLPMLWGNDRKLFKKTSNIVRGLSSVLGDKSGI